MARCSSLSIILIWAKLLNAQFFSAPPDIPNSICSTICAPLALDLSTMSTATILTVDENNNDVDHRTPAGYSLRRTLALIGAVALVGTLAVVGIAATGSSGGGGAGFENDRVAPPPSRVLNKSIPSGPPKVTLEDVRALAKQVGSVPPSNLAALERQGDICYTQGCLDAAVNLLNSINFTINPCDDFYRFSCDRWLSRNTIPPAFSRWSQFNFLRDEVNNITQDILLSPKDIADAKPINQVKDLYAGCVDTDKLESEGLGPLRNTLKEFGDWQLLIPGTWNEANFNWVKTIGDIRRRFLPSIILSVYIDQDFKSADENIIYVDQPSLVLPRDMLINEGGQYDTQITAYKQYAIELANELARVDPATPTPGVPELAAAVNEFVAFEAELAKISMKDEDRSDYDRMYNKFELKTYQDEVVTPVHPGLNLKELLDAVFSSSGVTIAVAEPIVVLEREYVVGLANLLKTTPAKTLSNYINFRLMATLGGETTQNVRDIAFKFNKVLTGAQEPPRRQGTCADAANNGLGMAIGVKYIQLKFDEKAKAEVNQLVEDLRVAFKNMLVTTEWMDDPTRAQAQIKADKMKSFMAYPDWLSDKVEVEKYFEGLDIAVGTHFVNVQKLTQWAGDKVLKTLRQPVDRNFWLTYPGVVNAFYSPSFNSITFPAGILQPPFFKSGYPAFLNYGGIGVVIGHEITHGFDHQGRQFDSVGNVEDWWTPGTSTRYNEKAKCIEDQHSAFSVDVDGVEMHVNGLLTLGENIADNGGVREAYIAYHKYVEDNGVEKRLPGLEQFEPDQLFFMGYANIWCENITPAGLRNQLLTDPHSPARFRVRGPLTNNADFADKWRCPVGSGMNPDPTKRCILW